MPQERTELVAMPHGTNILLERLSSVDSSSASVTRTAEYVLLSCGSAAGASIAAQAWLSALHAALPDQMLALVYVANHMIQKVVGDEVAAGAAGSTTDAQDGHSRVSHASSVRARVMAALLPALKRGCAHIGVHGTSILPHVLRVVDVLRSRGCISAEAAAAIVRATEDPDSVSNDGAGDDMLLGDASAASSTDAASSASDPFACVRALEQQLFGRETTTEDGRPLPEYAHLCVCEQVGGAPDESSSPPGGELLRVLDAADGLDAARRHADATRQDVMAIAPMCARARVVASDGTVLASMQSAASDADTHTHTHILTHTPAGPETESTPSAWVRMDVRRAVSVVEAHANALSALSAAHREFSAALAAFVHVQSRISAEDEPAAQIAQTLLDNVRRVRAAVAAHMARAHAHA